MWSANALILDLAKILLFDKEFTEDCVVWDKYYNPQSRVLRTLKHRGLENIVGKGENFPLFPTLSPLSNMEIIILPTLNLSSSNAFNLDKAQILSFGLYHIIANFYDLKKETL